MAVTTTRNVAPTSPAPSTYDSPVAPTSAAPRRYDSAVPTSTQPSPAAVQRCQRCESDSGPALDHNPSDAASVEPSTRSPDTDGNASTDGGTNGTTTGAGATTVVTGDSPNAVPSSPAAVTTTRIVAP